MLTQITKSLRILLILNICACSSQQIYVGLATNCNGEPVKGAEIEAWKNQILPLHLPVKLAQTTSDASGAYVLATEKSASFFTYTSEQLIFSSHPEKSISKCTL